jgi:protein-disulfide isomerase
VNWSQIRPWLGTVARLVLGVVFLIAGWQKLDDPRAFLRAVRAYEATPEWLSHGIAYGLPVLEICVGLLLIFGVVTRYAAAITGVLLVFFLIGIIEVGARGIKLECGCFGGGGSTTGHNTYLLDSLRDVGLLVLAVFLVLWPMTRISLDEFLARNDNVAPPSAKRLRTDQGLRKYNALLEARKAEARTRSRYLLISFGLVVLLVTVIGIGVQSNRAKIQGTVTATNASATNGVVLGKASKVTIDLFADFQCPFCEQFAQSAGADIDALIAANKAQVRFHMVSFLDSSSNGNRYSSRAANAALCASDISPSDFLKYHDYLYSTQNGQPIQPAENSNGRTDADLEGYAKAIGIDGDTLTTFQACVTGETHKALVEATTENWSKRGFNGTPILLVNGKQITNPSKDTLDKAVKAADPTATQGAAVSGAPSIVPDTPSPTATGSAGAAVSATPTTTTAASPTPTG